MAAGQCFIDAPRVTASFGMPDAACFILSDGVRPGIMHELHPFGAIATHAGKDHTNSITPA